MKKIKVSIFGTGEVANIIHHGITSMNPVGGNL